MRLLRALGREAGARSGAVLVGGAVRDLCLGRAPADLDVAVRGGALALAGRLASRLGAIAVPLDPARGQARVVLGGLRLDLADFRGPALEDDLRARDFTVNALAVPLAPLLRDGRAAIVDPTGGRGDLAARRLRPAGPGVIADDPLRALRGVRFAGALALAPTRACARALADAAPRLGDVAPERVGAELLALLALPDAARALRLAERLGVLGALLPEAAAMRATTQPLPHRFDVLEHSLRAVAAVERLLARPDRLGPAGEGLPAHLGAELGGGWERGHALKLAALLHDIAKPETRAVVAGRVRFLRHDVLGAARTATVADAWRLPGRVGATVAALVRHHLRVVQLGAVSSATPGAVSRRAAWRFYRALGEDSRDLLLLALADGAALAGETPLAVWRRTPVARTLLRGWAAAAAAQAAPLVTGHDVLARTGLAPGPAVGRLLARVREAAALGRLRSRADALAWLDHQRPRA